MKRNMWFILIVLCALVLVLGSPTGSQAAQPPAEKGDMEAFRAWLTDYFADWEALYPQTQALYSQPQKTPAAFTERIRTGQQVVAKLTTEELAMLKDVFDKNPSLANAPKDLQNAINQASAARQVAKAGGAECPPGVDGGTITLFVFKAIALGTEQAGNYVPGDLVSGPPGFTVGAHPAKLVLNVIKHVAQWVVFGLETASEVNGDCEKENAEATIAENLDTTVTSRASQESLTQHDKDIKALLSQSDTDLKALLSQSGTATTNQISQHDTDMKAALAKHDTAVRNAGTQIQDTLNKQVEKKRVTLQVIVLQGNWQFLVAATEAGVPLDNVQFTSVQVSAASPVAWADVTTATTVSKVAQGVYLVTLPKIAIASIITFNVKHLGDVADHFGSTLFTIQSTKNLGGGQ
jgi:hypothetical protein